MLALVNTLVVVILAVAPSIGGVPGGSVAHVERADGALQQQAEARIEPVDINTANSEALQKVPGIGETLARRIIEFREEHGKFEKVDDLLNVRGIGVASLEKLRPYLVVKQEG